MTPARATDVSTYPMDHTNMRQRLKSPSTLHALALCTLLCAGTWAQAQNKTAVVEPVQAVPSFNQWVSTNVGIQSEQAFDGAPVQVLQWLGNPGAAATAFQPRPVILGVPDLPLVGAAAAQAGQTWNADLNYQGVHLRYLVLGPRGTIRQVRPMSAPLRAGERFKIRIVSTFGALATVDRVSGSTWSAQRAGQMYPEPGMSVQMYSGETVDLPLGPYQYFEASANPMERIVLSVRHAQARGDMASDQPAYRQDGALGSNYLQLIPRGKLPAIEQVIAADNNTPR